MSASPPLAGLRRLLQAPTSVVAGEGCQRCGAALPADHRHAADLGSRTLLCVCHPCHAALSAAGGEGGGRRAVPERYLRLPPGVVGEEEWDAFQIPVGIAFFFHNSALGRSVVSYPGPAGATESLLPPEAWERVLAATPWTRTLAPDVEALLVRRDAGRDECFVVPIDACYALAGTIRGRWSGFGGGPGVAEEVEEFFRRLRERAEAVTP